ncbi:ANTAR domain-containing protein [Mycolicibacterium sp. CBM1]
MAKSPHNEDESPPSGDVAAGVNVKAAIDDLAGLVAGSRPLAAVLGEVAAFAARAIPGADGVGVALLNIDAVDEMVDSIAVSAPFVGDIDRIQYTVLREGPCITAASQRRTVRSGSLGGEKLWPRFGPRVGRLGVHSVLALPMLVDDQVIGAISAYAFGKSVFGQDAAEIGELFAKPAAVAVYNARILARALALADRLQEALATRPIIDQAVGLIRGRTGRSADDALGYLRSASQAEQRKLVDVAQRVVDEAVSRARARTAAGPGV